MISSDFRPTRLRRVGGGGAHEARESSLEARRPEHDGTAAVLGRIGGVAAGVVLAGALICLAGAPGAAESRAPQSPSPAPGKGIRPPVGVIAQVPVPLFPGICPLQAAQQTVTVCWYDRSTDETKFIVYKRDAHGYGSRSTRCQRRTRRAAVTPTAGSTPTRA